MPHQLVEILQAAVERHYTRPWSSIESATLRNPAMLAPAT
jgi:hypothetical protein